MQQIMSVEQTKYMFATRCEPRDNCSRRNERKRSEPKEKESKESIENETENRMICVRNFITILSILRAYRYDVRARCTHTPMQTNPWRAIQCCLFPRRRFPMFSLCIIYSLAFAHYALHSLFLPPLLFRFQ